MSYNQLDIQPGKLLAAICSNLDGLFFGAPKNAAKTHFRELESGKAISFLEIGASGHDDVLCELMLDHSQYVGQLNFTQFRNALAMHLQRIVEKIKNKEDLNIFTSEESGDIIFHIPGITENSGSVNILVTGIEQRVAGKLTVRLMFLDPDNYSKSPS